MQASSKSKACVFSSPAPASNRGKVTDQIFHDPPHSEGGEAAEGVFLCESFLQVLGSPMNLTAVLAPRTFRLAQAMCKGASRDGVRVGCVASAPASSIQASIMFHLCGIASCFPVSVAFLSAPSRPHAIPSRACRATKDFCSPPARHRRDTF